MKKNWLKGVLCLTLVLTMLAGSALAAAGVATDGWTRAADDATVTYNETAGSLTVGYAGSDLVANNDYVLMIAKLKSGVDPNAVTLSELTSASWEDINTESTIKYIDQGTGATAGITFNNVKPMSMGNSVVLLGGDFADSTTENPKSPKVLGVIIGHGVTVSGTVTVKGAAAGETATVELDGTTKEVTLDANGAGTYSFDAVSDGAYTLKVSGAAKYVAREYDVTVSGSELTQDVVICPKGDANGDGLVNLTDYGAILKHVRRTAALEGYALACADTNGDSLVNLTDYGAVLKHVRRTASLW